MKHRSLSFYIHVYYHAIAAEATQLLWLDCFVLVVVCCGVAFVVCFIVVSVLRLLCVVCVVCVGGVVVCV